MKKQDVLKIYLSQGLIPAIRYVRQQTGLPLVDCSNLIKRIKLQANIEPTGTITWYNCSVVKPPIGKSEDQQKHEWSDNILLFNKQHNILSEGRYIQGIDDFRPHTGNWRPTHWAFINLPVQDIA